MADNFQHPSLMGDIPFESIGQAASAIDLAQISVTDAQYLRFVVIKRMQAKFTEQENFVLMFKDEAQSMQNCSTIRSPKSTTLGIGEEYFIAMNTSWCGFKGASTRTQKAKGYPSESPSGSYPMSVKP